MRSAKDLCAMLITRSLKSLNDDEEEAVADYLDSIGVEVDLGMKPRDMCELLLEKTMEKELGKKVPVTAYANQLLGKSQSESEEKLKKKKEKEVKENRKKMEKNLEKKSEILPGCLVTDDKLMHPKRLYDLIVDPTIGIVELEDGTSQYTAVVAVSGNLYEKIFLQHQKPVIRNRDTQKIQSLRKNRSYT